MMVPFPRLPASRLRRLHYTQYTTEPSAPNRRCLRKSADSCQTSWTPGCRPAVVVPCGILSGLTEYDILGVPAWESTEES